MSIVRLISVPGSGTRFTTFVVLNDYTVYSEHVCRNIYKPIPLTSRQWLNGSSIPVVMPIRNPYDVFISNRSHGRATFGVFNLVEMMVLAVTHPNLIIFRVDPSPEDRSFWLTRLQRRIGPISDFEWKPKAREAVADVHGMKAAYRDNTPHLTLDAFRAEFKKFQDLILFYRDLGYDI